MRNNTASIFAAMADAAFKEGKRFSFRAAGHSMSPFIRHNEIVIIEPAAHRLRIGDVILFRSGDCLLRLHRITGRTCSGYITRGDAAVEYDEEICSAAVLGRAVHVDGGRSLHLKYPFSRLMACLLGLRSHPLIFGLLKLPARLLLPGRRSGSKNYPLSNNRIDMR